MLPTTACDEIIDFIMSGESPEQIDAFRPSERAASRISCLLDLAEDSLNQPSERSSKTSCNSNT